MAKKINVTRAHSLDTATAMQKLKDLTSSLADRYGVVVNLSGERATIKGKGLTGSASVADGQVVVDLKAGFPASLVSAKIEAGVNKALDEHFS